MDFLNLAIFNYERIAFTTCVAEDCLAVEGEV
jgi:hypothetical protein